MADSGWSKRFEDAIELPDGSKLHTLREAGEYVAQLPEDEQHLAHWETAAEMLLMAAKGEGPVMHARIGMLRALHAGRPKAAPARRRKRAKAYKVIR
jgi:hypothetical protein